MLDLGEDLIFACLLYAVLLVVIGAFARQARQGNTLSETVLGGRSLGFFVLLSTLFATQYSGNSFSGFPGQTYREGLAYVMSVTFMTSLIAGYMLFAPKLFELSRRQHFVTPTDYLEHRFRSRALNNASAIIFFITLSNFLLAQLIALGQALSILTNGVLPYGVVVVAGGSIMLLYQLMGGMRAVAWTDVFQAVVFVCGLLLLVLLLWMEVGSPASVMRTVNLLRPDLVATPSLETNFVWLSNLILLTLGAPLYPQAIQRIFAARKLRDLRRSLGAMALIPLIATTTVVYVGAAGIALFPELDRFASDQVTWRVISYLAEARDFAYYPSIIVILAGVAATMSTGDSCLLTVASILTKDVVARNRGYSNEKAESLTWLMPLFSTGLMGVIMILAMWPLTTLWGLLVIKFEILIQLSPAFVLGTLHEPGDRGAFEVRDVLAGLVTGLVVTLGLYLTRHVSMFGLQAGAIGVTCNYAVVLASRFQRSRMAAAAPSQLFHGAAPARRVSGADRIA